MHELLALITFALSLFGVQLGGTSYSDRLHDGGTVLHSEAWVGAGNARFECVESSSGRCHYRLLPPECASDDCAKAPLRQFDVAEGAIVQLAGVPEFRLDVSPFARR
jgi:hypothetical protein